MRSSGGRDVVRLVDDQEVELAWMARMCRQDVAHGAQTLATLDPVHRSDEPGEGCPRVGVDAAFTAQLLDVLGVDQAEIETELLEHLDSPLLLQRGRTDDQHGAGAVPEQQLLDDKPRLDGLAQADVVGDEQVDPSHVDGANQRVELEVFDADATAERRLQEPAVGVGGRTPTHSIQEGLEGVRVVLARDRRQAGAFDDLRARLDLPDDLEFLAEPILVDGREGHESFVLVSYWQHGRFDISNNPLTPANFDKLTRFRVASGIGLSIPFILTRFEQR